MAIRAQCRFALSETPMYRSSAAESHTMEPTERGPAMVVDLWRTPRRFRSPLARQWTISGLTMRYAWAPLTVLAPEGEDCAAATIAVTQIELKGLADD